MLASSAIQPRGALTTERRREAATGFLFILPSLLGFLVFVLGPLVAALAISFTRYDIISAPRFVGFDNYVRMLSTRVW